MDKITQIVNLIATALSARLTYTLSQQIAAATQQKPAYGAMGTVGGWIHRMARHAGLSPTVPWSERFNLGQPSEKNARALARSSAAWNQANSEHADAKSRHAHALEALENERKNPTGLDMTKLQLAVIDYEHALQVATKKLADLTGEHGKLKTQVTRQTEWQKRRTQGNLWSPRQAIDKAKQAWRVGRKQLERLKSAWGHSTHTSKTARDARRQHQADLAKVAKARHAFTTAKTPQAKSLAARGLATAQRAAQASGIAAKVATSAAAEAGVMVAMRAGALLARGGPIGIAIAAAVATVVLTVSKTKAWMDRQLTNAEGAINGRIRNQSQFNANIAAAMAKYDQQQYALNIKTAAMTSQSAAGLVRSTMAAKETLQPRVAAYMDIANRLLAAGLDTADYLNRLQNKLDFWTPLLLKVVKALEWLPWVKKIADNTDPGGNVGLQAIMSAANAASGTKQNKPHPPIPPVR